MAAGDRGENPVSTVRHDKLVRDRIPELILANGRTPVTEKIPEAELPGELRNKLREETAELLAADTREAVLEEAADVLEVIRAYLSLHALTFAEAEEAREAKRAARGGFDAGIRLLAVTGPD